MSILRITSRIKPFIFEIIDNPIVIRKNLDVENDPAICLSYTGVWGRE